MTDAPTVTPAGSDGRDGTRPQGRRASRIAGPLRPSIPLGRIAGVEIGANWTWLIVVALILWTLTTQVFPVQSPGLSDVAYGAMGATAAILFFGSLVLHELGHAVRARREGMEIGGITLWVFGGVAWFKGMFPSAGAELRIALAGPAVTALIAAALIGLSALAALPPAADGIVTWVGQMNLLLLVFNLIPALPLDGGRVLRAVIWKVTADFVRATRTAGGIGTAIGQVMALGGLTLLLVAGAPGGLWLALLGWIVTGAASSETRLATARQALAGLSVSDAMTPSPVTVAADQTLDRFMQSLFAGRRHATYPVAQNGAPVGLLSFRRAARVPCDRWNRVRVAEVADPLSECVVLDEATPLADALSELGGGADERALVVRDGALSGILSTTDLARMIELCRASRRPQGAPGSPAR